MNGCPPEAGPAAFCGRLTLIVGIVRALEVNARWIERDLGANPIVSIFTKHQRECGEVCFVEDECLRQVLEMENRLHSSGAVIILELSAFNTSDRANNFFGKVGRAENIYSQLLK